MDFDTFKHSIISPLSQDFVNIMEERSLVNKEIKARSLYGIKEEEEDEIVLKEEQIRNDFLALTLLGRVMSEFIVISKQ